VNRRPAAGARIVSTREDHKTAGIMRLVIFVGTHDPSRAKRGFTRGWLRSPRCDTSV